jgi:hypothetical protein
MSFKNIKNWVSEELSYDNGVTVLYPGGFKPMTGGHLSLILRYAEDLAVGKIRILVGPGIRNGIDQNVAAIIAERLTRDIDKVSVEKVQWPSPVLTAYKIVGEAKPGYYALAASTKGEDYKRVQDFVAKFGSGGKYLPPEGVKVIELPVNADPLLFVGRNDEHEGEPISASVLRNDIVNDDFDNFVTGYPDSDPDDIQFVWDQLAETVMNESQFSSSAKPEDISEGGGAGHLMSPWEATDMTFGEISELIADALGGKLETVTEKLDGQNLMVTVKDGNVYLARTQKQMKNGGELAMRWDEVSDSMGEKTQEFIKKAFQQAANDLQTVMSYGNMAELNKLFKRGSNWLNIELLNPDTENVVPYGEFQLRIHNIRTVDENGKEIDVIWEGRELDKIIRFIEEAQSDESLKKIHLIKKTNSVNFEKIRDIEKIQEKISQSLNKLMDSNHLDEKNTIGDYLAQEIRNWLSKNVGDARIVDELVQRWAYGNKTTNIAQILKGTDDKTAKWIRGQDKKSDDKIGELLDPLIEIFSRVGIAVLQNLSGIAASNKDAVSKGIRSKAEIAIENIRDFSKKSGVSDMEDFEKKLYYLETQLRRIDQAGGLEGIAPVEGVVFEYKGRLFKLTGIYLPVLKIINFFQFGKDK